MDFETLKQGKELKMKHKTSLKTARMQATIRALGGRGWRTSAEIAAQTGSVAVHSDVADLRASGVPVECKYSHTTGSGRRVYKYRMIRGQK